MCSDKAVSDCSTLENFNSITDNLNSTTDNVSNIITLKTSIHYACKARNYRGKCLIVTYESGISL